MVGFDDLYRQGGAVTWQAGKEDVVRQAVGLLMDLGPDSRVLDFGCGTGWTAEILTESGARYLGIDPADFVRPATVIQIGLPPNRIDLLTELTGVEDFEAAWNARAESQIGGRDIPFLGRATLIANKRATGRLKDLADIEALGEDV